MASALLTPWHIQCIHPKLRTDQDKFRYISKVNIFLSEIWHVKNDELHQPASSEPVPAMLEVAEVENSQIVYRGASKDAVRLRFRLNLVSQPDDTNVHRAVKYFCLRIFDLKATGQVFPLVRLISSQSLLGIEPLSQLFRLWWTRGFLQTFVHRNVSLFNPLADAEIYTPWLRGAALIVVAAGLPESAKLVHNIGTALKTALLPETQTVKQEDEQKSKRKAREFGAKVEKLLRYLDQASQACATQREIGSEDLPSDYELELFEVIFEVLQAGFEALTINIGIFDQWVEIVSSADAKMKVAGYGAASVFGVSVGAFLKIYLGGSAGAGAAQGINIVAGTGMATSTVAAVEAGAITGVTTTTAATSAAGTTVMSALASSAVLGPLGLCAAGTCIFAIQLYFNRKSSQQVDKKKRETEEIQGLYQRARMLSQWLVIFSKPATTFGDGVGAESQEMQELRTQMNAQGFRGSYNLADWMAILDSEMETIRGHIARMTVDPACQHIFD